MAKREVDRVTKILICIFTIIGVGLSVLYVFNLHPFGFTMLQSAYLQYLLVLFLAPVFLLYPISSKARKKPGVPIYDIILFLITAAIPMYFAINAIEAVMAGWEYSAPPLPTYLCIVMWILIVEAIRRVSGIPLATVCAVFSFFPLVAASMPGFLNGVQYSLTATARAYLLGQEGVFGVPLTTVGTQLIGFMLFGAALEVTGCSDWLLRITTSFFGRQAGGSAKIAVVSSGLFGSLSGSVISNIATIGTFAIPEMKKGGYEPEYAGAIEACASTGGALMPPVMGAAAFIMASFLKVQYVEVCFAAAIPSILYYLTLFVQSDSHAKVLQLKGKPNEDIPKKWETFKSGWYYIFAFFTLVFVMAVLKLESRAPYFATIVLFVIAELRKETRITKETFLKFIFTTGKILIELTAILAAIGLIIGGLTITGVSQAFSRELVSLVGNNLFLLLAACAATSMVLGMGMTVTACYTFLAVIVAPAMIRMGVAPMAAHLFVLYWGLVSYITPPVAVGAITAAGVAGGSPIKTGFVAMRLGIASYIVPFAFAYNPALVLAGGTIIDMIISFATTALGVSVIAFVLEGYLPKVGVIKSKLVRILFAASGVLMLFPQLPLRLGAVVIFFGGWIFLHNINISKTQKAV